VQVFLQGSFKLFLSLEKVLHIDGQVIEGLYSRVIGPLWKTVNFEGGGCKFDLFLVLKP